METLEIKKGWFVHWHHDLYGGITYGLFDSEQEATEYTAVLNKNAGIDVGYLPYVEYHSKLYVLGYMTECTRMYKRSKCDF